MCQGILLICELWHGGTCTWESCCVEKGRSGLFVVFLKPPQPCHELDFIVGILLCSHRSQDQRGFQENNKERFCTILHRNVNTWTGTQVQAFEDLDMEEEPPLTFGNVNNEFLMDLHNLWISWPDIEIWLAKADVKSCLRIPKLHPDDLELLGLSSHLCRCSLLQQQWSLDTLPVQAHENFLSSDWGVDISFLWMIWKQWQHSSRIFRHTSVWHSNRWFINIHPSTPCSINHGNQDKLGQQKPIQSRIYVNDSL